MIVLDKADWTAHGEVTSIPGGQLRGGGWVQEGGDGGGGGEEEEEKYPLLNISAVLRWSSPGYSCQRTDKCCDQHYRKEVSIVLYNII